MKNYYAIYPGPDGLTIAKLGKFDSFDKASDEADKLSNQGEPVIWIAGESDLRELYYAICRLGLGK